MKPIVLVVDDDANIRNLLQVNLIAEGYDVLMVADGEQAIAVIATTRPHLVLLDIMMPGTDGWEVAKFIRDNDPQHEVKIIMLTARDTARDKMIGTHVLKADQYITKPFDIAKLLTLIQEMTDEQKPKPVHLNAEGISSGRVIGPALVFQHIDLSALKHEYFILDDVGEEIERLREARQTSITQLAHITTEAEAELAQILEVQSELLQDDGFLQTIEDEIHRSERNSEHVLATRIEDLKQQFLSMDNELLKSRHQDIQDAYFRLLRNIMGIEHVRSNPFRDVKAKVIVVCQRLLPSDIALLDFGKILGLVIEEGGRLSHVAIIARSLRIPAILGATGVTSIAKSGDTVLLDAQAGRLVVHPDREDEVELLHAADVQEEQCPVTGPIPCITADGERIELLANIGSVEEAGLALSSGADGVGLLRTEFFYMMHTSMPSTADEVAFYGGILGKSGNRPVTVRLIDIGADKTPRYIPVHDDPDPQLGHRGIRVLLRRPELFTRQLRCLFEASANRQMRILLPFVSTLDDVLRSREIVESVRSEVGILPEKILLGIMVEIPSTALAIESYLPHVDFVSIGTNDLVQYLFAVSREADGLDEYRQGFHPALLQLIHKVVAATRENGKEATVCGEMAATPAAARLLVGLGARSFSMAPESLCLVREGFRQVTLEELEGTAQDVLHCSTQEQVVKTLCDFAERRPMAKGEDNAPPDSHGDFVPARQR